ncbi:MAG: diheme cytochrome c-553 [Ignavibacteriae bacterium]|nr:diheme cytochrome c-553 [Ignavibacteria bacterium]MBI3364652.1 diheme cytochrome c-553 [Ignavibacteriota bacterium]
MNRIVPFIIVLVVVVASILLLGSSPQSEKKSEGKSGKSNAAMVERGRYIVNTGACNDCHSPKIYTKDGPIPDTSRLLSGHPASEPLLQIPTTILGPDKWGAVTNNHFTAWAGPWGVSFTRNLTPDTATGIGSWTEEMFMKAIRTGKHMGEGRDILPPMPWPEYRNFTDNDLRSIFAYLRTLKPIENAVPDPISPTGEKIPTPNAKK